MPAMLGTGLATAILSLRFSSAQRLVDTNGSHPGSSSDKFQTPGQGMLKRLCRRAARRFLDRSCASDRSCRGSCLGNIVNCHLFPISVRLRLFAEAPTFIVAPANATSLDKPLKSRCSQKPAPQAAASEATPSFEGSSDFRG